MSRKGIDVSTWQGEINWDKVKNSGIEFAIIRSGWGYNGDGEIDKYFKKNINEAKSAGIKVGVYHYSYADSVENAKQEAEYCLNIVDSAKVKLDLPIYFDIEDPSILNKYDKNLRTNMCIAFCSEIEKAGYWAGVYSNLNWFNNYLNKEELSKRYTLWLAQYNNINEMNCDIWQYTSSGSVSGINGNVDMNIMYRDLIEDISKSVSKTQNSKGTENLLDTTPEMTYYTVKDGDTLSKIASIYNTTYQYLAEINKIKNPDVIYVGETIVVPNNGNFSEAKLHIVKSGETLWSISEDYLGDGSKYKDIMNLNNLSSDIIYPGDVIKISN